MSDNGLQITNGTDISQAEEGDFVFNTKELGGMHIAKILTFKYADANIPSGFVLPTIPYKHKLGFSPAFLAYNSLGILRGHQNEADPQDTVNASPTQLLISFGTGSDISVIIFAEQMDK